MKNKKFKFTSTIEDHGQRIDRWIVIKLNKADLTRTRVKNLILNGHLNSNNKKLTNPSYILKSNEKFELSFPPIMKAKPEPEKIKLDIIYEDRELICINKQAGMVVHPAPGNKSGTLVNALLSYCKEDLTGIGGIARPGIVHRLDKDTSGVLIVAKTNLSHLKITEMFSNHSLERKYYALIWGIPNKKNNIIKTFISRDPANRKRFCVKERGKLAITKYSVISEFPPFGSLIECELETGRTHQIRVHMSYIGHGVIGDQVYGRPKRFNQMVDNNSKNKLKLIRSFKRQALHAKSIKFKHPLTNKNLFFNSELPMDMKELIELLKN